MRRLRDILLALIPAILVFVLIMTEPFYSLDAMLCDTIYKQMNGTGDTIKLICIDEETLEEYGTFGSWSREKAAELMDLLYSVPKKAPAVLAFDVMFIGENDPVADERLVEAAKKTEHLVLASNLVYRGKTKYNADGSPFYDKLNIETEERPFNALDEVALSGYANVGLSKDGFVRSAQIFTEYEGETRYSFANLIYREYLASQGKDAEQEMKALSLDKKMETPFFYSGVPGEMIHFSLKDVLSGRIALENFADSIVMVGVYAPGMQDSYHSSAKRGQEMYGVEINANIVRAFLSGKVASKVPALPVALVTALLVFLYFYLARAMKMYPALLMGVWVLLLEGIVGRVLATKGHLISLVYVLLVILFTTGWLIIEKYVFEIVKKKRMLNSFRKYMAPQVLDNLAKDDAFHIELGGELRQVAVLFVDIRGFTSMSEVLTPKEVVQILNQYLALTTSCIFDHGGMLDKFVGDATMAIFNAPNDQEDYVYQAVLTALDMQTRGAVLGEKLLKEHGRTVSFGVGVHMGEAVIGNIGCDTRMDYTAIGDTVNTAARLESRALKGEILISETVYKFLEDRIQAEFKENMTLKGKAEPVPVYMVTGVK